jgi:hypothetical protein
MADFNEFYITDGADEVNLMLSNNGHGMGPERGGIPAISFDPSTYYHHLTSEEDLLFLESWTFVMRDGCPDSFATRSRKLFSMLIKAWLYRNTQRYKEKGPVYIVQRVRGETEKRFARVFTSPVLRMMQPLLNHQFELENLISNIGIPIARFAWEDGAPGTIPSSKNTFDKTNGGATAATLVPVANHYDDHSIDTIYRSDNGVFSANLFGTAAHAIFPAAPAINVDFYYVGSDEPFWHILWNIVTASVETGVTYLFEYSDGGAGWPDLTLGDDLTLYPDDDPFDATGISGMFFHPGSDWAKETVNGDNKFWIRISISALTTYTTAPENGTDDVYNQRQPYALLPSSELEGDVPPLIRLRMLGTYGGDENVEMTNLSRVLIGAKSRNLDEFDSHLNPGGDGLPANWAVAYGTDTSTAADPEAPGGDQADCDFAGDTSNVMRVRFTGTGLASAYKGKYRPFIRCQQIGGDVADVTMNLRIRIDSTADYAPQIDTSAVSLGATDDGHELVDLEPGNYLQIPFGEFYEADSLEGADLIIEIWAQIEAGSAGTLEIYDLILLPVDEWWGEYEDPVTNSDSGSSALRGEKILIDDGGLVEDRAGMFKIDGSEEWFTELWERHGKPPSFVPLYGDTYRLHFIFAYYNATWGGDPMLSTPGMGVFLEWESRNQYLYLRGDD